jgi:hypothetical protein
MGTHPAPSELRNYPPTLEEVMKYEATGSLIAAALLVAAGCATYGMPVQHLADAEASIRSARDSFAVATPAAQLHLKLAEEELSQARHIMSEGDSERADFVLVRARADAELAVAEEHQAQAAAEAQQARAALSDVESSPTGITKTTGAVVPAPVVTPPPPPLVSPSLPPPSTTNGNGGPR